MARGLHWEWGEEGQEEEVGALGRRGGSVFKQPGILGCESRSEEGGGVVRGRGGLLEDVEAGSVTYHYGCVAG